MNFFWVKMLNFIPNFFFCDRNYKRNKQQIANKSNATTKEKEKQPQRFTDPNITQQKFY